LTIDLAVDLGFSVDARIRVRIANVDAPEMTTPEGKAATFWAMTLLAANPYVVITTEFDKTFDRYVATVELPDGTDYGAALVDAGHAKYRTAPHPPR
jgi:endonuclease YncB( thermonuclease family)